jgi:hypothetical protein
LNFPFQSKSRRLFQWFALGVLPLAVFASCLSLGCSACFAQAAEEIEGAEEHSVAEAEEQTQSVAARTPRNERTLQYWAGQLSNERFLRRQSAQRHLVSGGQASVPVLRKMLDQGDLETIETVIAILAKIADQEELGRDDGAIATLESIAKTNFGTKATLAQSTLRSFADSRGREARIQLTESGVVVGMETVALGARSSLRPVVKINESWNGDLQSLAWLRWLGDVRFAVVEGAAAKPEVFEAINKMPNLSTLVLIDTELTMPALKVLQARDRIDAMELRYIRLNDELLAGLMDVRLRNSLYLMGTGVSEDQVQQMRLQSPGLEISLRQGGFLGVICRNTLLDFCEVSEIIPGSGADDAGLQARDIIIRIDDVKITRFDDLQRQINTHIPGDEIAIRYRRNDQVIDTSATLRKLKNQ